MSEFNEAINIVLKHEGGYANDPIDPGGETNYGISKARYPDLDIASLSKAKAKELYFKDFWKKFRINEIQDQKTANLALDTVVHHGRGVKILQLGAKRSGKDIAIDNRIGPQTLNAINTLNPTLFINNAVKERIKYMEGLVINNPSLKKYLTGWKNRASFFLRRGIGIIGLSLIASLMYLLFKKKKRR